MTNISCPPSPITISWHPVFQNRLTQQRGLISFRHNNTAWIQNIFSHVSSITPGMSVGQYTTLVQTEISERLLDGCSWNVVQACMVSLSFFSRWFSLPESCNQGQRLSYSGQIVKPLEAFFGYKNKIDTTLFYLSNFWIACYETGSRSPDCPEDNDLRHQIQEGVLEKCWEVTGTFCHRLTSTSQIS